MKRKSLFLILLALLLVFTLAACGGGDKATETAEKAPAATTEMATQAPATQPEATKAEEAQPTAAPEKEATSAPQEEPTATPEEKPISEVNRIEDVVNSYHSEGEFTYQVTVTPADDSEDISVDMTFESDWVKADNTYGYNMATTVSGLGMPTSNDNNDTANATYQLISIDDTTYIKMGDQWISAPRDQAGDESQTFSINIDEFASNLEDLDKVGTETVNGIKATHYTYKDESVYDSMLGDILSSLKKENENIDDYDKGNVVTQSDIWIANDGKYPVKAETTVEATFKSKVSDKQISVKAHTLVEISNINGDITIEPPADAPKPGEVSVPGFEPGTFPIPDQTTVDGSMAGMTTMTSQLSVDEVTAFYDEQLTSMGWTKTEGIMPTWTKDGNSFTLMITPGDNNTTSIVILPAQQ